MLKVLLENNGEASIEQIASALLSYDQSQVEYYGIRTKQMVGKVLTNNGVVEPVKSGRSTTGFKLNTEAMSEAQRASLVSLCDDNIKITSVSEVTPCGSTEPLTVGTFQALNDTTC
jgi:actin-like ATPase involved in cell morphogenesis